ncbi:hypothetical protein CDV57_09715, partial [Aspergillus fumigatus]
SGFTSNLYNPTHLDTCTQADLDDRTWADEIFVYDRRYVSEPDNVELPELPSPEPFTPDSPPDTLANQNDLQAWRHLYMARRSWALTLSERGGAMDKSIQEHNERTDIINRAAGVALENLKTH